MNAFFTVFVLLILFLSCRTVQADSVVSVKLRDLDELVAHAGFSVADVKTEISLEATDSIWLAGLYLQHPSVTIGTIERGPLIRLIDSSRGSWSKAPPASLVRPQDGSSHENPWAVHGVLISPFPKRLSLIALKEADLTIFGAYLAGTVGGNHRWEVLSTLTRSEYERSTDEWLFEEPPALSSLFSHVLTNSASWLHQ